MKKSILALTACVTFGAIAPAAALAQGQMAIRVGGNVQVPERTKYVAPVYPELAAAARVSGVVIIEAVVERDGSVADAKILRSIPLLDQAALDAVQQWKYTPTMLNGVAVPVIMTVTVNFTVSDRAASGFQTQTTPAGSMTATGGSVSSQQPVEWNGKPAIRVGGSVMAPERIKYVAPVYPEVAQSAQVSGIVILEGVIDPEGNVASARVLKSIPLLDQAALDAVMQWKYTSTQLNGVAVPVVMTVTVVFSIGGR